MLSKIGAQLQIRRNAFEHFNSLAEILYKIEAEVDEGRLAIRTDRNIHDDVGLRGMVIELLQCYNTPWLKLGLETVLGCEIVRPAGMSQNATDRQVGYFV